MIITKKGYILTLLLAYAFGIGLVLLTATSSMAVHKGAGDLVCGACHTMHSSQGGTSVNSMGDGSTSGSFILLRTAVTGADPRANLHNFCLQCHSQDGAQAGVQNNSGDWLTTPPKVHLSAGWDGGDFSTVGGGGLFLGSYAPGSYTPPAEDNGLAGTTALGKQHSIGSAAAAAIPPGNSITGTSVGTALTGGFSCTSCHDPHGTNSTTNTINKYRNLKAGSAMSAIGALNVWSDMANFGDLATSYVGGVGGSAVGGTAIGAALNVWPVWRNDNSQNSYRTAAVTITLGGNPINAVANNGPNNVGFSAFCAQCHGSWHEAVTTNSNTLGPDWKRHPVNNTIVFAGSETSSAGVSIIDFTHYNNSGDTSRAPYTTTNATKVPAANVSDVAAPRYYADSANDKVFCLTCHFSHGSIYNDLLRWNYTSAVDTGSQRGNAIASNVGCQQCHNR